MSSEPVAWGMPQPDGAILDVITPEEHARAAGEYTVPLYTHPPQRKPLTDEEIWREYQGLWPFHPAAEPKLAADIAAFARAIERAHGIGGEA